MDNTFSTPQVAKRFGVAENTVKNWASEFAEYLSPTAKPEAGKRRAFTADDVAILALVHELVGRGRDTDAAHVALRAGRRGESGLAAVRTEDSLIVVQHERDMLQGAVLELRAQLERIEADRQAERAAVIADREELLKRLHRAELTLELYKSGDLKPPGE